MDTFTVNGRTAEIRVVNGDTFAVTRTRGRKHGYDVFHTYTDTLGNTVTVTLTGPYEDTPTYRENPTDQQLADLLARQRCTACGAPWGRLVHSVWCFTCA